MIDCTAFVESLDGKPVAVFGLGLSGLASVEALVNAGAKVLAWDDTADAHGAAKKAGADVKQLDEKVLEQCACLILAPGVPLHFPKPHPVVLAARAADIEIIGDLEVLHRCAHGRKTIGITGTNGKSTTTALITHILKESGQSVAMGGNIGKPVLALEMPEKKGFFVLEVSSYQIDLCPSFRPDMAVLLNITPDHIDRHGSFDKYAHAKERLFEGSESEEGLAIISLDDEPCRKIYERLLAGKLGNRRVRPVSCEGSVEKGVYAKDGVLFDNRENQNIEIGSLNAIPTLRGTHNHENAAVAFAVCCSVDVGLEAEEILKHIRTFEGLPYRQFPTRTINGVAYINDSKATNAEAAGKALASYRNIYWIAGGRPKGEGLQDIVPYLSNIKHVFLIGEAMMAFAGWLDQYSIPYTLSGELTHAVNDAHAMAQQQRGQPGGAGTVLLSPACASFDQFKSFEARGDLFSALVEGLEEKSVAA